MLKPTMYLALFFVIVFVLIAYSYVHPTDAIYRYNELGDIYIRITGGGASIMVNEIGTFEISICSDQLCRDYTLITNETTAGTVGRLPWDIDFDAMTGTAIEIEWVEAGKMQWVEL